MSLRLAKELGARAFATPFVLKRRRAAAARAGREAGAVVLVFHRLFDGPRDFLQKGPSVQTPVAELERFLERAAHRFAFVSLDAVVRHLAGEEPLPQDALAVTLDDGYADNLTLGLPVFRRFGVPATVYLATGFIGGERLLPMDRIDHMLLHTEKTALAWDLLGPEPLPLVGYRPRCAANTRIGQALKNLPADRLEPALADLGRHLDVDPDPAVPGRMLTWGQVGELLAGGMDVGSHGVSHVCMTRLDEADAAAELAASRAVIRAHVGHDARHFAIPNGTEADFNDALRGHARAAGYASVASVLPGVCAAGTTDLARLPRVGFVGSPERTLLYIERLFARALAA